MVSFIRIIIRSISRITLGYELHFNIFNVQVKHVTTHRSEPRGLSDSVYNHGPVTGAGAKRSVPESFQPGVIVQ